MDEADDFANVFIDFCTFAEQCAFYCDQDFEAVVKLASVTELLIGEGQQTPVSIAFFTYSCA